MEKTPYLNVISIVGKRGEGKSTQSEKIAGNLGNVFVFGSKENDFKKYKKFNGLFADFVKFCESKKGCVFIFDEASKYVNNKKDIELLMPLLVDCRHRKNLIIFNYHFLGKLHRDVLAMTDVLILMKTGDNEATIKRRFAGSDLLLNAFMKLKKCARHSKISIFDPLG